MTKTSFQLQIKLLIYFMLIFFLFFKIKLLGLLLAKIFPSFLTSSVGSSVKNRKNFLPIGISNRGVNCQQRLCETKEIGFYVFAFFLSFYTMSVLRRRENKLEKNRKREKLLEKKKKKNRKITTQPSNVCRSGVTFNRRETVDATAKSASYKQPHLYPCTNRHHDVKIKQTQKIKNKKKKTFKSPTHSVSPALPSR